MPNKTTHQPKLSTAMPKWLRSILVLMLVFSMLPSVFTQSGNRWAVVINQLLDYPAPPPPMLKEVADLIVKGKKPSDKEKASFDQGTGASTLAGQVNPALIQNVASIDPATHHKAGLMLVEEVRRKPNREAVLALLPWFTDPGWVTTGNEYDRYRVIEVAGNLKLPEAVPGLLAIIQNEKGYARTQAVMALAQYRDSQTIAVIIPALRSAVWQNSDDSSFIKAVELLVANDGLNDTEILSALESLAAEATPKTDNEFMLTLPEKEWMPYFLETRTLSQSASVGYVLARQYKFGPPSSNEIKKSAFTESIATGLLERINALQTKQPEIAAKLWTMARVLGFLTVYAELAKRISATDVDLETMLIALNREQQLAAHTAATLQPMLQQDGYVSGIGAALLNDAEKIRSILEGRDREAQIAVLACARLVRMALPIESVGKLLTEKYKPLAMAAERYLESEDSPAARRLVLARHPNEALILGGTPVFHPKPNKNEWEDPLREEVKRGQAEEIFGVREVYFSDAGQPNPQSLEIHVLKNRATLCHYKESARKECRSLLAEELTALRILFDEVNFDELSPLSVPASGYGGTLQTFIRLNKNGGRRVVAFELRYLHSDYGYGMKAFTPHDKISVFFNNLKNTGEYELRYALKEKIKELKVISADDKYRISQVCGQNGEVRALVKDDEGYNAQPKWRAIKEGKLGEETDQPTICQIIDRREDLPESLRGGAVYAYPLRKTKTKDGIVRGLTWNEQHGLWFSKVGSEPRLLTKHSDQPEAVTPDGRWLIAIKRNREADSDLLRIDLKTGQTEKIEVQGWVYPISVEPLSGRVVIPTFHQNGQNNQGIYEVKLYTPSTGKIESATGEFEPLKHQHDRQLQPLAGSATEFWAAIPDNDRKKTSVGRYDAHSFKFIPQLELPEIVFNSTQMWVDEAAQQLYLTYNGHLLRLPFPLQNTQKR
jgi:hypothetical protein